MKALAVLLLALGVMENGISCRARMISLRAVQRTHVAHTDAQREHRPAE